MDPTLSLSGLPPVVLSTREFNQTLLAAQSPSTLVVVAEGIPPISCKLVEKIKQWEYIDLATLLDDHPTSDQGPLLNGQLTVVSSNSQRRRQAKAISDILTWLQAFSIFTAVLVSSDSTTKEEAAGLAAHSYLIIQLSKDLSGLQWLKYDQSYREWAAAKGIRKWGEMNFSIYGRCLASQHSSFYTPTDTSGLARKRKANANICYRWNEGKSCSGSNCRFAHRCGFCGGNHREIDCSRRPKRP